MNGRTTRYDDEDLQEALASEYAVGNLRGAARRRLQALMLQLPALRRRVERWEAMFYPHALRAPRARAPASVWRGVHRRISPGAERVWRLRLWWSGFAVASACALMLSVLLVGWPPGAAPEPTAMAVLAERGRPAAMLVSWTPRQALARQLTIQILDHPTMPPGTSWQLWLVDPAGGAPVSLGLVSMQVLQSLEIPEAASGVLARAAVLAVSVEPKGGSPTGRPSLPYQFEGEVRRTGNAGG